MTLIEAAKQALEALRHLKHNAYKSGAEMGIALDVAEDAITALRTAITEAEKPEPVACRHEWFSTGAMEPNVCRCIHCGKGAGMKENIIRMAREAGWHDEILSVSFTMPLLERFAEIVEDAQSKRMFDEGFVTVGHMREQIAKKVAEEQGRCCEIIFGQCDSDNVAQRTVNAIRGEK